MAKAKGNDETTPTTTRRSRRVATAPQNVMATCIAELEKLDEEERARVMRAIAAYFGGQQALPLLYPPGVRGAEIPEDDGKPTPRGEVGGGRFA